jgi:hypothetical protein
MVAAFRLLEDRLAELQAQEYTLLLEIRLKTKDLEKTRAELAPIASAICQIERALEKLVKPDHQDEDE